MYCKLEMTVVTVALLHVQAIWAFRLIPRRLLVLGDSLSDNGLDAYDPPKDAYGFKQFSNGPVWGDYLAKQMGVRDGDYINMAYSGALSNVSNYYGYDWSGVQWQAREFVQSRAHSHSLLKGKFWGSGFLVAIQAAGINDFFLRGVSAETVAENLAQTVRDLREAGGKQFLIFKIPDASSVPALKDDPDVRSSFADSIREANQLIEKKLNEMRSTDRTLDIDLVEMENLFHDLINSEVYINDIFTHHRDNATRAEVHDYIWFDDWHPLTNVHKIMAEKAWEALNSRKWSYFDN